MKISEKMQNAINSQINAEFWSAYLYLSMSVWFEEQGLKGFSHWMKKQFDEEQQHALKFMHYVHERGGNIALKPIEKVRLEWESPADAFQHTYDHENVVTNLINELYKIAVETKDFASQNMLDWFIKEQVEEEATALEILETLRKLENNAAALIMLDKEMGQRS